MRLKRVRRSLVEKGGHLARALGFRQPCSRISPGSARFHVLQNPDDSQDFNYLTIPVRENNCFHALGPLASRTAGTESQSVGYKPPWVG